MKRAFVSGASRGIGFETAKLLTHHQFEVFAGYRDQIGKMRLEGLDNPRIHPIQLDICSSRSIDQCAEKIKDIPLHLVVNSAAIRLEPNDLSPTQHSMQLWRKTLDNNLLGHVELTIALLDSLKSAHPSRIVNVSSLLASNTSHQDKDSYLWSDKFKSMPAYSAAKAGLNSWTLHLAYELQEADVSCISVHPGYTRTGLNEGEGDQSAHEAARVVVSHALNESLLSGTFYGPDGEIPW